MSLIVRPRARARNAALAFALLAGVTAQASPAWSASDAAPRRARVTAISADPYRNPDSQHRTQVEPAAFAAGSTVVSAFQVGRFIDGGSSNIGFATSTDSGRHWRRGFLPRTTVHATPAGPYRRASDPSVAYDARHKVWLISYLGVRGGETAPSDVLVSRSLDGGLTWGAPVAVAAIGHFLDKNWTTCDTTPTSRYYGRCYTQFDDVTRKGLIQLSTSTDGGSRWGRAVTPPGGAHGLGGQPLVRPDGTLVVPYVAGDSPYFLTISSFASVNGGATLTRSTVISAAIPHATPGLRAGLPLPSAQVDRRGRVYVVWSDCRFEPGCAANDLVLSTSADARTWTPVRRIPIDRVGSGVDHVIPGLGADSRSRRSVSLGLTYYFYPNAACTPTTCRLAVGFISSRNGGASWSRRRVIAGPMSLNWLPNTSQGRMVGDYIASPVIPGQRIATPVFSLARSPTGKTLDQAIYAGRMRITGGSQRLGSEPAVARGTPTPLRRGSFGPTAR